jgi:hypothetical protein
MHFKTAPRISASTAQRTHASVATLQGNERNLLMCLLAALLSQCSSSCIFVAAWLTPDDPRLPHPRVISGESLLEKRRIATCPEIGEVTDIAFGRVAGDGHERVVVAGTLGYALIDPYFETVVSVVRLEPILEPPFEDAAIACRIVDVDGDGEFEFARLSDGFGRCSLHRADGSVIWAKPGLSQYRASMGTHGAAGDIDGDGKLEFLITCGSQVMLVDRDGCARWTRETWETGRFLFLDIDGDGRNEIVFEDGVRLCVRDANWNLVATTALPGGGPDDGGTLNRVNLLRAWGDPPADTLEVGIYTQERGHTVQRDYLVALDAKTVGACVPWADIETRVDATRLHFASRPELAWAARQELVQGVFFAGVKATRLRLRITDERSSVRYEEIVRAPKGARVANRGACFFLPAADGKPARLFVGYGSGISSYTVRE